MFATIISSIIIIIGATYIGVIYGSKYEIAVSQLDAFINALKMLEFDISFLRMPLGESFERVSKSQSGTVKKIFSYMANELAEKRTQDVGILFKKSLDKFSNELLINDEVKNTLYDFSENIGCMDAENEIINIKAACVKLRYFENEARELAKKNVNMCRSLGALSGIFIVILLC